MKKLIFKNADHCKLFYISSQEKKHQMKTTGYKVKNNMA
ncbi:hypothetical protein Sterm_0963 [Sebaldella termitidis ATCC 33386]|uniref:Uncharacterized protein n=1 Tax=Sebaldella termitidis (strain ATCC 33386 / NCTC 11300) TaxID=526218 RepID=D1AFE6_SEBTE|nr:hypothetical protein Sterm_0963 [Sebaldella termitidis ATCC 33386]